MSSFNHASDNDNLIKNTTTVTNSGHNSGSRDENESQSPEKFSIFKNKTCQLLSDLLSNNHLDIEENNLSPVMEAIKSLRQEKNTIKEIKESFNLL